jgi:signal transduction histidine kinase
MRLHGVGVRLSLALFVVLLGALAIVYAIVVPSLEQRLVDAKLSQLEQAGPSIASQLPQNPLRWQDYLETASGSASARVVIYDVVTPGTQVVVGDSHGVTSTDVEDDPVALEAAQKLQTARGTVTRDGERFAEAAQPVVTGAQIRVVLLSASLRDALRNVSLVRHRLLIAGALALLVSLVVGYSAAAYFARRLRRLERAADRIAGGRFDERVQDPGRDEVGELARAFERMRGRLAQLDHARREFIANASHELRTPLFSLSGFLELLDDEELDDSTRREFLTTAREQVGRLTKLAADLLDLSRLDAGRLRVEEDELDLGALATSVVEEFRGVAGAHAVEVDTVDGVLARGDDQRVRQIGRILLENALVHTPPSTPVSVLVRRSGDLAILAVIDSGPGLPPEHAGHVFERFYRADTALASGSGLGLAIARELAELMGGRVTLDARPGRTEFRLELPPSGPSGAARDAEPVSASA